MLFFLFLLFFNSLARIIFLSFFKLFLLNFFDLSFFVVFHFVLIIIWLILCFFRNHVCIFHLIISICSLCLNRPIFTKTSSICAQLLRVCLIFRLNFNILFNFWNFNFFISTFPSIISHFSCSLFFFRYLTFIWFYRIYVFCFIRYLRLDKIIFFHWLNFFFITPFLDSFDDNWLSWFINPSSFMI